MTNTNKPTRLAIPQPFASGTGAAYTPIQNTSGSNVNFVDGFPSAYQAPSSSGGKYVTRGEMNAIGRLASQNNFCDLCGLPNIFNADIAALIGGYPQGAILDYVDGSYYYKVISLVDDNKVDYTGTTPTASQATAGVTAGGVDGVNWARMNLAEAVIEPIIIGEYDLGEIDAVTKMPTISMNACSFVTPRTGAVSAVMTLGELVEGGSGSVFQYTATLYYRVPGTSSSQSIEIVSNSNISSSAAEAVKLPAGTLCSLILTFGNVHFSNVKLKVTLV